MTELAADDPDNPVLMMANQRSWTKVRRLNKKKINTQEDLDAHLQEYLQVMVDDSQPVDCKLQLRVK